MHLYNEYDILIYLLEVVFHKKFELIILMVFFVFYSQDNR